MSTRHRQRYPESKWLFMTFSLPWYLVLRSVNDSSFRDRAECRLISRTNIYQPRHVLELVHFNDCYLMLPCFFLAVFILLLVSGLSASLAASCLALAGAGCCLPVLLDNACWSILVFPIVCWIQTYDIQCVLKSRETVGWWSKFNCSMHIMWRESQTANSHKQLFNTSRVQMGRIVADAFCAQISAHVRTGRIYAVGGIVE